MVEKASCAEMSADGSLGKIPKKCGPKTAEGKARAAMNAVKHGLRARKFLLLPEEDPEEFESFARAIRLAYAPEDAVEQGHVEAIVIASWRSIRTDRIEAEVMADIPAAFEGRGSGSDLVEKPENRASLQTALRYRAQAQMELKRATSMLEAYRKARHARPLPVGRKLDKRSLSIEDEADGESRPHDKNCTNEFEAPAVSKPVHVAMPPKPTPRDPMRDDPALQVSGRDADLVLPVAGLHPSIWSIMQQMAKPLKDGENRHPKPTAACRAILPKNGIVCSIF